jgi:phosphatidylserine/phosphatidylglycerophosphate/cardiolipin synthase-like enzyme
VKLALRQDLHHYRRAQADASAVIVDARAYYRAFYRAALEAERYLLLAGWQFDTEVPLLRGDDARDAPLPVTFLPFLEALCQRRPELRIYVLAWDYSWVYALEREWLQGLKFALQTSDALRFEFDPHPRVWASNHQKFVVVDGELAFAGGMDICDERWDDCGHDADAPLRVNTAGEPCRPNHEVQAAVTGEAAAALAELFCERWRVACGEDLTLPPAAPERATRFDLGALTSAMGLPLRAAHVYLSRTEIAAGGAVVTEIRAAYEAAIAAAERLIYVETQYFTSRSIASALIARLREQGRSKLQIIVVLPRGADSGKEKFALGETQSMVLGALEATAREMGHELHFLCTVFGDGDKTTFIHSKVLIVDDQFLSVGSANLTERSMGLDRELALFWLAEGDQELASDIAGVRAALLAEHAGRQPEELRPTEGLAHRIGAWLKNSACRLRSCHFEPQPSNALKTMIFDPGGPLTLPEELPEEADPASTDEARERLERGSSRLRNELARRSRTGS